MKTPKIPKGWRLMKVGELFDGNNKFYEPWERKWFKSMCNLPNSVCQSDINSKMFYICRIAKKKKARK